MFKSCLVAIALVLSGPALSQTICVNETIMAKDSVLVAELVDRNGIELRLYRKDESWTLYFSRIEGLWCVATLGPEIRYTIGNDI